MAGGIAHEFNNLLQVIRGYTEFVTETIAVPTGRCAVAPNSSTVQVVTTSRASLESTSLVISRRTSSPRGTVGFGGDWTQAAWGAVGGISYRISTEAPVTINGSLVSLFENNLVAILAEAEYGFLVNDMDAFTKLTNTNNTPVTSS